MPRIFLLVLSLCCVPSLCAQTTKNQKTVTNAPASKPNAMPPGYKEAKFELPPAVNGSWINPRMPSTNAPPWKPRGKVYLPADAQNVALHKPVISSDDFPIIGDFSMVTDGEKRGTEGHWVEIGPGTQWVQIDLKANYKIHGVLMWHYFGEPYRVYRDVIIRLADDATFSKNVRMVYNNDDDNSSGLGAGQDREYYEHYTGQWIPFKPESARYVRFYSRGNTSDPQNQYIEAEVWASPVKIKGAKK